MPRRKGMNSRKRRVQRKRSFMARARRSFPVIALVLIGGAGIAGALYGGLLSYGKIVAALDRSALFTVGKIAVKGNRHVPVAAVLERCGIASRSKIYQVKTAAVTASLLDDPWIEQVRCVTRWWGTVAIEISERTPIALVNAGEIRLVDRSGVFLPVEPGTTYDLPLISSLRTYIDKKGKIRPDSIPMTRVARFIEQASAVKNGFFTRIGQLDVGDTGRIRCIATGRPVVIDIEYDAEVKQLRNLWYLLEALESGSSGTTRIDLRYQNLAFICREPSGSPHGRTVND